MTANCSTHVVDAARIIIGSLLVGVGVVVTSRAYGRGPSPTLVPSYNREWGLVFQILGVMLLAVGLALLLI